MLKNLLLLSGFSTFVVVVIIGLNIYHDHELSSLPSSTQIHVTAITPNFDKKSLDQLKKRVSNPVNLQEKSGVVSEDSKKTGLVAATPTPTVTLPIAASKSASTIPINPGIQP